MFTHALQLVPMVASLALLAACAVVDSPTASSLGTGIPINTTISIDNEEEAQTSIEQRLRAIVITEVERSGYNIVKNGEYRIELGFSKRSSEVGILLADADISKPESGTWRSRPVDQGVLTLCDASIFRLMVVVRRAGSGEIRYRGSGEDDVCGEPTEQKLRALASVALADMRLR